MKTDTRINIPVLIAEILREAETRGWDSDMVIKELGLSRAYFISLTNRNKPTNGLSLSYCRAIAKYLHRSVAEVELLAGVKEPADFFAEDDIDASLTVAYRQMQVDPAVNHMMTFELSEWVAMPQAAKIMMTTLYYQLTGKSLLKRGGIPMKPLEEPKEKTKTARRG